MKYKVMIADDQFVARQLFELYVKSSDNYEVAVSVDTAAMVENLLETVTVDLIIMDVLMNDGSNGLVAAEKIKKLYPEIKIIVVTSMAEVSWMERAKKAGIEGLRHRGRIFCLLWMRLWQEKRYTRIYSQESGSVWQTARISRTGSWRFCGL